jgi:hypothetical protein
MSGPPFSGTERINKGAFHSEGKMNKAGSCIAAMQESGKKAGFRRPFIVHRIFPEALFRGRQR